MVSHTILSNEHERLNLPMTMVISVSSENQTSTPALNVVMLYLFRVNRHSPGKTTACSGEVIAYAQLGD